MSQNLEAVIRAYLPSVKHLSLGTSKDNKPWVCEVHFAFDDTLNLYYRSLTSRRHSQEIAENPHVAGDIIRQHAIGEYPLGIYFEGTAEKLDSGPEQQTAAKLLTSQQEIPVDILAEAQRPDGPQFYKISVSTFYIFGKLDDTGGKKYQLAWNGGKC
jgi:uncharacterized protein YhbP (UPF0306 family)